MAAVAGKAVTGRAAPAGLAGRAHVTAPPLNGGKPPICYSFATLPAVFLCKPAPDGGRTHNLREKGSRFSRRKVSFFTGKWWILHGWFATACYMASFYSRPNSPFLWLRYKDGEKWKARVTEFRKDNPGDRENCRAMVETMKREERIDASDDNDERWDAWVDAWLVTRYGQKRSTTLTVYRRHWRRLRRWLEGEQIGRPSQFTFRDALRYKTAREKEKVGINTIVHELKFLGVVIGEAIRRGFCKHNPCLRMGLQRAPVAEKVPWSDTEVAAVAGAIKAQPDWMQATFILGFYQAARMRQAEVPLRDIDLKRMRISYWRSLSGRPLTKGNKPFAQPIAKAAVPLLRDLMERRRAGGFQSLCDIPLLPSVEWRRFLDTLGFGHLVHHGLRTTWITQAALSRKISREEAKAFVNHGSTAVHEIYQRLNADDVAHVADALDLPEF